MSVMAATAMSSRQWWIKLCSSGAFEDVAGENEDALMNFNYGLETGRIFAVQAARNFFTALGVPVAHCAA